MADKETEFKFLLEGPNYERLVAALGTPSKTRRFVNRYFTVPDSDRKDWVLRLRSEGEVHELTLKIGRELSPGVFDSLEFNEQVTSTKMEDWANTEPIKVLRREVSEKPIALQGEAKNHRLLFSPPLDIGRIWEVDRCELPDGTTFCELEIEVELDGRESLEERRVRLVDWLERAGVTPQASLSTKYARFLASLI